ncbi:ABC transporter ATP-binding protein [Nocardioides sp.]|uniref:ABC transporter ATP-binding protein n=1 Tax=Nocardioides sp. TaxID=35761 RepID=UPI0039E3A7D7
MSDDLPRPGHALVGQGLRLCYDDAVVADDLHVQVPRGALTMIVGPNGCGKSTLLKALARMMRPERGTVLLDGEDIHRAPTKAIARRLGLLPQTSVAPDGITVGDLVSRGRFPYQRLLRQWSRDDEVIVNEAMAATGVAQFARRAVDELSGGERQRVWLAMVLAQQTQTLLLDEPTTYLDLAHQIDVLELCASVMAERDMTIVVVIHELNLAVRYADHLIVMKAGAVQAVGAPEEIVTAELIEDTFGLPCRIIPDPETGKPLIVPRRRAPARHTGPTPVDRSPA